MPVEITITQENVLDIIELNLLDPTVNKKETIEGCKTAKFYHLPAVCVKPCYVQQSTAILRKTQTNVATVISFPFGDQATAIKLEAAKRVLTEGAKELNMVVNSSFLIDGDDDLFQRDINTICCLARMNHAVINVILNCAYLAEPLIHKAAQMAVNGGATWISPMPVAGKINHEETYLKMINQLAGKKSGLKIMGPIEDKLTINRYVEFGCRRIGTRKLDSILSTSETK